MSERIIVIYDGQELGDNTLVVNGERKIDLELLLFDENNEPLDPTEYSFAPISCYELNEDGSYLWANTAMPSINKDGHCDATIFLREYEAMNGSCICEIQTDPDMGYKRTIEITNIGKQ